MTAKPKVAEKAEAGRQTGRVKWFDPSRGYGFIAPDGGDDLFLHVSQLTGGLKSPADGTRVSFVLGKGPKGRTQAQDVRPA
ncbi:MAG: cold-shock protein [Anaerolineae bacterium]